MPKRYVNEYIIAIFGPLLLIFQALRRPHKVFLLVAQNGIEGRIIGLFIWAWATFFALFGLSNDITGDNFLDFGSEEGRVVAILLPLMVFFYFFVGSFFFFNPNRSKSYQNQSLGILLVFGSLWILLISINTFYFTVVESFSDSSDQFGGRLIFFLLSAAYLILVVVNLMRLPASRRVARIGFLGIWLFWPLVL